MIPTIQYRIANRKEEKDQIMELRFHVFVEEQKVPFSEEYDELDETAVHYGGFSDTEAVACGRILFEDENRAKLGRIATKKEFRKCGLGYELCTGMIDYVKARGVKEILIHAQVHAVPFYKKLGFISEGAVFDEAGIPHITMKLAL